MTRFQMVQQYIIRGDELLAMAVKFPVIFDDSMFKTFQLPKVWNLPYNNLKRHSTLVLYIYHDAALNTWAMQPIACVDLEFGEEMSGSYKAEDIPGTWPWLKLEIQHFWEAHGYGILNVE
ncbi:uncharacterized protein MELLADRAFT_114390 [Melampsora larici-populina 98AG31]|uniref:Uncharacterized protein n=1 Tax=Melampsora larici-populina (strain 98AG31 / pathotype 3-4-7) TaxID=747676 RepID=F4SD99_MELLP|nr:uncharacterized protein MELLADRAFT_114390 [Melampsora larici-populina 98AG31]EGF97371.1 hypothetical protein MELLADRAFT_114390 [Melampsora larici-populina 98AG31]